MLTINQSLIKEFLDRGNEKGNVCPRKIYVKYIYGLEIEKSDAIKKGLLFEDLCFGTNRNNIKFPRVRGNRKSISEQRIEFQAHLFKETMKERKAVINEMNTQILIYKRWEMEKSIILKGTLDVFPTTILDFDTGELGLAIIDTKFTGNIDSSFGKFRWGELDRMDHLQAVMYNYLVRDIDYNLNDRLNPGNNLKELTSSIKDLLDAGIINFWYYIADDKPNYASKFIKYILKPGDFSDLNESIRKTVNYLIDFNEDGWKAQQSPEQCMGNGSNGIFKCPYTDCKHRKKEIEI